MCGLAVSTNAFMNASRRNMPWSMTKGFAGRGDHADAHDSLDDAHDEYHDERGWRG